MRSQLTESQRGSKGSLYTADMLVVVAMKHAYMRALIVFTLIPGPVVRELRLRCSQTRVSKCISPGVRRPQIADLLRYDTTVSSIWRCVHSVVFSVDRPLFRLKF